MRKIIIALTVSAFLSSPALAARGVVVLNKSGCGSRYVVETKLGYAILQWFGGMDPPKGTTIYGDFETYGMKKITFADGSEGQVWVEDFWLSRDRLIEKVSEFCG